MKFKKIKIKNKRIIILFLQIIVVIGTAFLFWNYTNKEVNPTSVYIYANDINDITKEITNNDIKKITIPHKAIQADFALKVDDIIGKHVDGKVKSGQFVYKNQLIDLDEIDIFDTINLNKYRKISLPINFVEGLAGEIKRGDKIDLIYTGVGVYESENRMSLSNFTYSTTFLQDILVYSVNTNEGYKHIDKSSFTETEAKETAKLETEGKQSLGIITLAVTLEDAEEIIARSNTGLISFVGRFKDSKNYESLGYVMGDYEKIFTGYGNAETNRIQITEK